MDFCTMTVTEKLLQHLKNGTINTICRVCFVDIDNSQDVSHLNEQKYLILSLYTELTSLSINLNTDPSMNFCPACSLEIEKCNKFRKKCIDADIILRDMSKIIRQTKYENSGTKVVKLDRTENKLGNVENGQEVKLVEVKDEHQEFEIEFLDESSLEPDDSNHLSVLTHKGYNRSKKTTANGPNRGRTKTKKQSIPDKATIIHGKESNDETKPVICLVCKKSFYNDMDLKVHMSLHDQNLHWVCKTCNKEYKDKTKLRRHILRHMSVKPHRCDICDKTFCEITDLKRHNRIHTGEIVVKKKCNICKARFSSEAALSGHECAGAGRRWSCWCGRVLSSCRLLASHQRVHDAHKPHACPHCQKRFRHDSTLITHLRTHSGEKPYMCSVCGKTFIQSTNLSLHMRTHTGEKPYSCKKCPMKFASGSSLKVHVLSHTEAKQTCDICGKTLAPASMLGHMRLHAAGTESGGEMNVARRHICSLCDKTFVTATVLREHLLVHTGEKPFECKFCPKKFPTKPRLERHNKLKHCKLMAKDITGTNYKLINEGPIQDLADSEDTFVYHVPVSHELVLQADEESKPDFRVIRSAITSPASVNDKVNK